MTCNVQRGWRSVRKVYFFKQRGCGCKKKKGGGKLFGRDEGDKVTYYQKTHNEQMKPTNQPTNTHGNQNL